MQVLLIIYPTRISCVLCKTDQDCSYFTETLCFRPLTYNLKFILSKIYVSIKNILPQIIKRNGDAKNLSSENPDEHIIAS